MKLDDNYSGCSDVYINLPNSVSIHSQNALRMKMHVHMGVCKQACECVCVSLCVCVCVCVYVCV